MQSQGTWSVRAWRAAVAGVIVLAAAGCSDTDDGGPDGAGTGGAATLAGTAAVGAPIIGGTVTAKCAGGQTFVATSAATGGYSIALPSSALPCALQVSGGTAGGAPNTQSFHSFASRSGTVNLTPLTDLAVALASGSNPVAWFNAVSAANPPDLDELTPAINTLLNKLRGAGYSVPANLNPVTTPFAPTAANAYDQLLEALADRLGAGGSSYGELLLTVVEEGEDFEPPPAEDEPGTNPEGTVPGTVSAALVGTYALTFNVARDDADVPATGAPFADQQQVPVIIGADNTLKIDGKTLTNPYFRKFGGEPHLPEIIWFDAAKKLEYALTDNQLERFNEINVGDTSQAGASGIPRFLGQLRKPEVTVTLPASLNGSYTARIVEKSGPINFTVGNNLPVVIASDSITVDGTRYVFQSTDLDYEVFNETASIEPRYRVSKKTDATHVQDLYIYVDGDAVVGFKLSLTELGNGSSSTSYIYAEKRPLPSDVLDFFDLAVSKTPVVLTVVQDDASYNSGYPAKCSTMRLTVEKTGSGDAVAFKYTVKRGADYQEWVDEQSYAASNTRYLENSGNKILAFSRNRISLRADGNVDLTALLGASVKDRATNDPGQILSACPP